MPQKRWKSKHAWLVMITSTVTIAGVFFSKETVSAIEVILGAIFLAVEAYGVFNNPTDSENY